MTKDDALKLALEALEEHHYGVAQIIIREALAQPEQEPVAWMKASDTEWSISFFKEDGYVPLYTTPPQRTWVGLSEEKMVVVFVDCGGWWNGNFWKIEDADFHPFLRTIEAKLKELNT